MNVGVGVVAGFTGAADVGIGVRLLGEISSGTVPPGNGSPNCETNSDSVEPIVLSTAVSPRPRKASEIVPKSVENFTIESDGRVSVARTKSSSMGHKGVEACISDRFMKIRFPQPKGGGIVTVNYPLLFKSSGE